MVMMMMLGSSDLPWTIPACWGSPCQATLLQLLLLLACVVVVCACVSCECWWHDCIISSLIHSLLPVLPPSPSAQI